jgi:Ca-activated chloride channel homolog
LIGHSGLVIGHFILYPRSCIMIFTSPMILLIALGIGAAIVLVVIFRRVEIPSVARWLGLVGIIFLALAAGGMSCERNGKLRIAVMVDCSASTRGASFRDAGQLQGRLRELLENGEFEFYTFADQTWPARISDPLAEIPSEETRFVPPPADAIVLFSDGRFELPATAPPVYAVIDPLLDRPNDAAVEKLEQRGDSVAAALSNAGPTRKMSWEHGARSPTTVPTGNTVLTTQPVRTGESATARISAGDLWPENDALTIQIPEAMASQRWWLGADAPAGWMAMSPGDLPSDAAMWLAPNVVVLNDVSADALWPPQMDRLAQYVRDLGGALIIVGGDHAFAAGGYFGTALESLSPLASSPPGPVMHWILLTDSSGSMATMVAAGAGNRTRFAVAADAMVQAARSLPGGDLLSIGSFARELRWWSVGKTVKQTIQLPMPPADVSPGGPTNLEAAMKQIAESTGDSPPGDSPPGDSLPAELLLVTDAETNFSEPAGIAAMLLQHRIRLDVLIIGEATGDDALAQIAQQTGGREVRQMDPAAWAAETKRMLRAALPDRMIRVPIMVNFQNDLAALPARNVATANRTWPKDSATLLASGKDSAESLPLAARWRVGNGEVMAMAFAPTAEEIEAMAKGIAKRPRDSRFSVQWESGAKLHVRVDAADHGAQLNGAQLSIRIGQGDAAAIPQTVVPQTAPGRYEVDLPSPRSPQIVSVRNGGELVDQFAVAGRYPAEFDAVGNDVAALAELAKRTGGEVIEPDVHQPIAFHEPRQEMSLASVMAAMGSACIGFSLVWWRRKA